MNVLSAAGLGLTLGLCLGSAVVRADDLDWRPTRVPPAVSRSREVVAATSRAATLGRPVLVAESPVPAQTSTVKLGRPTAIEEPIVRVSTSGSPIIRAQAPDAVAPPPGGGGFVPPPPAGGAPPGSEPFNNGVVAPSSTGGNWFNQGVGQVKDSFQRRCGQKFQSDHAGDLDQFSSPVSSPFLSEDPRSLTEVKPIFIYQSIPGDNPIFRGGNAEFFGLQARLALTEKWSLVLNKFGGLGIQPDNSSFIQDDTGFAEVWIGPKYTFFRDETNNTVAAAGLMFQIPAGSKNLIQDNGDLSLAPYFSFAKSFGKLPQGFGNFNYMSTTGFAFSVDSLRSDYFYSNFHIDFDVGGQHKFYPLMELNYIRYVNKGGAFAIPFEGGDLVNFGSSQLNKKSFCSFATGARYKFSECIQVGGAFEFPLTTDNGINDFRITMDVIFRY